MKENQKYKVLQKILQKVFTESPRYGLGKNERVAEYTSAGETAFSQSISYNQVTGLWRLRHSGNRCNPYDLSGISKIEKTNA